MYKRIFYFFSFTLLLFVFASSNYGQSAREPWTTSRVKGAPVPPLPYRTERVFGNYQFKQPVTLTNAPGTNSMFLLELSGKIYELASEGASPRVVGDLKEHVGPMTRAFGLAFHPDFESNREIYVCYNRQENRADGTIVSRFRLTKTASLRIEPNSEEKLYTWRSGGHNGGCVKFGPDGLLYVSAGDSASPFPPDPRKAGQDLSTLLSKIMRIDVNHQDAPLPYRIPADNPFVDLDDARPEVYAYGFRNPWRMAFDRETGDLWVGDVGWELWEMVYCVESGGNYGWSIVEGPQAVNQNDKRGPTPILKPAASHAHTEARSITGGQVYYGDRLPELKGHYIYGDHVTGRIWSLRKQGEGFEAPKQIARAPLQIICFGLHNNGEVYVVDYLGSIHQLVPQENNENTEFPRTLGESGLFASVENLDLADGVLPYEVIAEPWMDGATAERFVAIPNDEQIGVYKEGGGHSNWDGKHRGSWKFPRDSVLGKTISLEGHRIETQLLHYDGQAWQAYTYLWNDEQTDARLAPDKSHTIDVQIGDKKRPWKISNRSECMICHSNANDMLLGFKPNQLQRPVEQHNDQLAHLVSAGLFKENPRRDKPLADPTDVSANLNDRARSYLHVNCAHCHRPQGGGSVAMNVIFDASRTKTRMFDELPSQGTFGIQDAKVVDSGDPFHSVLLYRFCKLGPGHMPKLGGLEIDSQGALLLHDWVASLGSRNREFDNVATDVAAIGDDETKLMERLSNPSTALAAAHGLRTGAISKPLREKLLSVAARLPATSKDLFESFVPPEQRTQRLGNDIDVEALLTVRGEVDSGRALFLSQNLSCKNCHSVELGVESVGPNLSELNPKQYDRRVLLENIVQPSLKIDPAYRTHVILTADGEQLTGVAKQVGDVTVLRDAEGKTHRIQADDIEFRKQADISLMPEKLLNELTQQQARDLIEFLHSLQR